MTIGRTNSPAEGDRNHVSLDNALQLCAPQECGSSQGFLAALGMTKSQKLLHGDHDDRSVVLEALFAVSTYGLHQGALNLLG